MTESKKLGRVLEMLHREPLTVREVADHFKVERRVASNWFSRLLAQGIIWRDGGHKVIARQKVDTWTAKRPNGVPMAFPPARQPVAPKLRIQRAVLAWSAPAKEKARADEEQRREDWLTDALDLWGRWMRRKDYSALNYPPQCVGLAGGWLVKESEELYDSADLRLILAVDAAVESLPARERAAVWTAQGLCDAPEGDWIVDAMQYARLSVLRHLGQKGFTAG